MDEEDYIPEEVTFRNGNEVVGDNSTLRSQLSSSTFRVVDRHGFMSSSCDSNGLSPAKSGELSPRRLRKRESKWLEMFEHWPDLMDRHYEKVRARTRKGIPPAIRPRAWQYLCGAYYHSTLNQNRIFFEQLDQQQGDPDHVADIIKDLNRQFPDHELFSRESDYGEMGQHDLFRLLKAWTILHPEEGYCQGQAPIAATLLMHMPLSDAFYCFVQICHKYLPGYYSAGLQAIKLDGAILQGLLKTHAKKAYRILKAQKIDPTLYMVEWFMCIYCRTLPWPTVLRVWDIFFCEGVKVLFKVGVVLLRYGLDLVKCDSMFDTLQALRNLPAAITAEEFLIARVNEVNITDADLEKEHYRQVKKMRQDDRSIGAVDPPL